MLIHRGFFRLARKCMCVLYPFASIRSGLFYVRGFYSMITKNFRLSEFTCKCGCGASKISHELVHKLQKAREIAGVSFTITSGLRCPMHNKKSGGLASSSHLTGLAADISTPNGLNRHKVLSGLIGAGFTRIGIARSFIHADIDTSKPYPTIWLYS